MKGKSAWIVTIILNLLCIAGIVFYYNYQIEHNKPPIRTYPNEKVIFNPNLDYIMTVKPVLDAADSIKKYKHQIKPKSDLEIDVNVHVYPY